MMHRGWLAAWKALLFGAVIAVVGGLVLGGLFIFSGIYDVGATARHFDVTNTVIRLTLRRSVETHSLAVHAPDLSDERLARLGARHFQLGCAPCHASPATAQNPVAAEMYPAPPPLSRAVEHWDTEELFWIVNHGLKFTGMPAWPARQRDEEVWALVAFLERLPGMGAEAYADMAALDGGVTSGAERLSFGPDTDQTTAMCDACHGERGAEPVHPLAPPLAGQKRGYLHRALAEYAADRRQSGIMEPIAAELGPEIFERLARFYAERTDPQPARPASADAAAARRGAAIARQGIPDDDIPACLSCHSAATSGQFPRLDGLSAEYISTQLDLFRNDVRSNSVYAAIMAPIAKRLTREQIEDVAVYFASREGSRGEAAAEAGR